MTETIIRRKGNAEERAIANRALGEVGQLQDLYKSSKQLLEQARVVYDTEVARLKQRKQALEDKRTQLYDAQEVIDADPLPEGAQPVTRITARDHLKLEVEQLSAIVASQEATVKKCLDACREQEKKLFQADKNLSQFVDKMERTEASLAIQAELDRDRSQLLAAKEVQRAKRREKESTAALQARTAQFEELEYLAQTQVSAAKLGQSIATKRIQASNQKTKEIQAKLKEIEEQEWQDRAEAALELRTNQQAVRAKAASDSAKYQKQQADRAAALESQKESMLAKGLNPYVEFRRAEFEAADAAKEAAMRAAVEKNKAILAEKLIKEEDIQRKEEAIERKNKAYEKRARDELGAHIIEARNREYIMSVTSDHREVLDPTGAAARIDPSKITDIPDFSFGLGKSSRIPPENMKRITSKIRSELNVDKEELGEYARLVQAYIPKEKSKKSQQQGDGDKMLATYTELAPATSTAPGVTASADINYDENDLSLLKTLAVDDVGDDVSLVSNRSDSLKKYKTVELSKFEQDSFERAKAMQKQRVVDGTQQVAGGKVFRGDAFVSHPSRIEFVDFEVGKMYRKRFTLTNVSYTFNSFRILPLSDDIIDFFEITFEKPGRMSAGVSCSIDIRFSPKINKDINSVIQFYSETGPIKVPLVCSIRRCIPEIINPEIDFGSMVIGQQSRLQLKFKNTGARTTSYRIQLLEEDAIVASEKEEDASVPETDDSEAAVNTNALLARVKRRMTEDVDRKYRENPLAISVEKAKEGEVPGYGDSAATLLCAPLFIGPVVKRFRVIFDDVSEEEQSRDTTGKLVSREQIIFVKCDAIDLPIFLTNEVVDFKCTVHDRIYRKKFELRNRSGNTCGVHIKIPPPYNTFIEVNPTMVYVQSGGSQYVNVKFTPTPNIIDKLRYYSTVMTEFVDAAYLAVPVRIDVANQDLPVFFVLKGHVCSSKLELSSMHLRYGDVYVSQQYVRQLQVKNLSMLPQKLAFTKLKKELTVQPNEGFAVLLPNESITFDIALQPQSAISYDMSAALMTSLNDTYTVKVHAMGILPPLSFSSVVLDMRHTCPGEKILEGTIVKNESKSIQCFEIVQPDPRYSWIRISPAIVELEPGEACRLEVECAPPSDLMKYTATEWHDSVREACEASIDKHALYVKGSPFEVWEEDDVWVNACGPYGEIQWTKPIVESEDGTCLHLQKSEWGVVGQWSLPVYLRKTSSSASDPLPMYLSINTCIIPPQFVADTSVLDFGQMAVGTRVVKTVRINNLSNMDFAMTTKGLNAVGPFSVVNANRVVGPSLWHVLVLECEPKTSGLVVEVLELASSTGGQRITLTLKVHGVNPVVEITGLLPPPASWNCPQGGIVDFGNVVIQDVVSKKIKIVNKSLFSVDATVQRAICAGVPLSNQPELIQRTVQGLPLFSCRPESAVIPQGGEVEVEILFRPDRYRLQPFREDFNILVGKGDDAIRIGACGVSRERQIFVRPQRAIDEPFYSSKNCCVEDVVMSYPSAAVKERAREALTYVGLEQMKDSPIMLEFPDPYVEGAVLPEAVETKGKEKEENKGPPGIAQTRQFLVCCGNIVNGRGGAGAGSYEYILGKDAIESKFFSVLNDKGNCNVGADVTVTVTCTLPRPKGLGGLQVGYWKEFDTSIVLKGGWRLEGEPADVTLPIVLRAYVRL